MPIGLAPVVALVATASPAQTRATAPSAPLPPARVRQWSDGEFFFALGAAPGATFHLGGFNALVRYDAQLGMRWYRGRTSLSVGAEPWILQRLEARGAGGGLQGVLTASQGPAFARLGVGVLTGIAGTPDDRDTRASLSALAGVGLESRGKHVRGRVGLDYVFTVDERGRASNTVFLALGLRFG